MSRGEYLTEAEIDKFFNECNKNDDNSIDYAEIEAKLDEVHGEIAPDPKEHNLHHKEKDDNARHVFLRGIMQDKDILTKEEFFEVVRSWKIPTQEAPKDKSSETIKAVPIGRRIRAHLAVDGPPYAFLAFVVILMIIFGVWQLVTYLRSETRQALGWGVIVSKATAGVLYPTLFFMILSMSRHLSTFARYSYWISRFVNFDRAQSFHIKISIFAHAMGTLHGIGHLTGTFIYSSRPGRQALTAEIVGTARSYREYVATLPGVTGIAALGIFWLIAICSMPWLRSKNYEIFQSVHLLMFPFIGLLMAHGTWSILQPPMLGYWLAFPTLLVVGERLYRLYRGCIKVPAELEILDDDTVAITCKHPAGRPWRYEAGQYVLLQVPQISFFQWHPFTISTCNDNTLSLHIKTDGDWVKKLRSQDISYVGIDGPFGAPAQRFYDYEKTIIVGAGIGVTPFSGILNDLEQKTKDVRVGTNTSSSSRRTRSRSQSRSRSHSRLRESKKGQNGPAYRCDFHWMVRDKNYYLWFSDLLNRIQRAPLHDNLEVKIVTHLTTKRDKISTVIFRYLLDRHRTEEHPESALTGLLNDTSFGRPDWPDIMREHYQSMKQSSWRGKVGVFFCGAPVVGYIISDQCSILNAKAREDDVDFTYVFMMEVFG